VVRAWIRRLFSSSQRKLKQPWAVLEIEAFEEDGRIKLAFDYNPAFIEKIHALGFHAETDEDSVQLFFLTSALRPMALSEGDEAVQSMEVPSLSSPQNVLMQ
jgi:hypothetical protein